MQVVFHALAIVAILIISNGLSQAQPSIAPTRKLSQAQKSISNTIVAVSLPLNAKIWLKGGGSTTGQVRGFDSKQKALKLGEETIKLAKVNKVVFDTKAPVYDSDGKLVIRGEDTAQAKQTSWQNIPFTSFELKDPEKGVAQVDLAGVMKPLEIKGIKSVAVNTKYVVDEIQFPSASKITIKLTPGYSK